MNIVRLDAPLIIGSGVAGCTVATALGRAVIMTRGELAADGSSHWAQGGIAVAMSEEDSPQQHAEDTRTVSGGIADSEAVRRLTEGGPEAVRRLMEHGAQFDRDATGTLRFGREAGHRRRRILHADGDATGREVMRALRRAVSLNEKIIALERHAVVDLVMAADRAVGVVADDLDTGLRSIYLAPAVVLATGGMGRMYRHTTNPPWVNGDGLAMAARIGARMADLEFMQFHPTALCVGLDPMPLLTEALRGEGATLVDGDGKRYMPKAHVDAELAPRDVVARETWKQLESGSDVYLDARLIGDDFPTRFPTVFNYTREVGLDPRVDLLPVSPAAHYTMGGIAVDDHGRSSVPGLYAVGEVTSTGVHGANRLASNSLLEGLVFGLDLADAVREERMDEVDESSLEIPEGAESISWEGSSILNTLRERMWNDVGVVRSEERLRSLIAWLDRPVSTVPDRNAVQIAHLVAESALRRTESRGSHYREDYRQAEPAQASRSFIDPSPVRRESLYRSPIYATG
jgi:L-aspartate oxidase